MSTDSETVRSQLRLPGDLYEQIKDAAGLSGRSMNAEIVHRLERSLKVDRQDAFEVLLQAREDIHECEKHIYELDNEIQRASEGDTSGLAWIANTGSQPAPEMDEKQLIEAAQGIRLALEKSKFRAHERMNSALNMIWKGKGMPHLD